MREQICCICYEKDNYNSMINCHFCNEGSMCCECASEYEWSMEYEWSSNIIELCCPVCKSILIGDNIKKIIFYEMDFYATDFVNEKEYWNELSPLIKRFVTNYMNSDMWYDVYRPHAIKTK